MIENPAIRWFIPRLFKSANTEKVHHKKELEKMLPFWKNIKVPVIYVQGKMTTSLTLRMLLLRGNTW